MTLSRLLNCVSYAAVFVVYLVTGSAIHGAARAFSYHFELLLPGKPLPHLTESVLSYGQSGASLIVNLILGAIFSLTLFYLEFRNEKWRALIPFWMAFAFSIAFIQLGSALIGFSMPDLIRAR